MLKTMKIGVIGYEKKDYHYLCGQWCDKKSYK